MEIETGGETPEEAREEIELKELSELSGLSPEEIKKFREMQDKYGFGKPVESFWAKERPLEEKKTPEREAFDKMSIEERSKILQEYAKYQNQITDRKFEMTKELTGYERGGLDFFADLSEEELKRAEAKYAEWKALPPEERQKRREPIQKLEALLSPRTKEEK